MTDPMYGKRPEDIEELRRFLNEGDWLDWSGRVLVHHAVRQYLEHIDRIPPFEPPKVVRL